MLAPALVLATHVLLNVLCLPLGPEFTILVQGPDAQESRVLALALVPAALIPPNVRVPTPEPEPGVLVLAPVWQPRVLDPALVATTLVLPGVCDAAI